MNMLMPNFFSDLSNHFGPQIKTKEGAGGGGSGIHPPIRVKINLLVIPGE